MPDGRFSSSQRSSRTNAVIRRATADDAVDIVAIAADVWPDERLDANAIRRLLTKSERGTTVAELDDEIVGFVDGFPTDTVTGEPRWEVDLLAVSSAAQGHGIGRALVRASVESGISTGAVSVRGLVRVENVASEHVFRACGFIPDAHVSELWVSDSLSINVESTLMHAVPVKTFRYEGVWLEAITVQGLRTLRQARSTGAIGTIIPTGDHEAISAAQDVGMRLEGEFRFWHRILDS